MNNKVGLITYHDTANHGAALQLYSTLRVVSELGYDIEAIDYTNEYRSSLYIPHKRVLAEIRSMKFISAIKTIIGYWTINSRLKAFDAFYAKHTKRSVQSYNASSNLSDLNKYYNTFMCGSDQIWSLKNNGGDLVYLLNFAHEDSTLVSYASSLGMDEIEPRFQAEYIRLLNRFEYISVREKSGSQLLEKILKRRVKVVLDPVFLLTKDDWLGLIDSGSKDKESTGGGRTLLDYTAQKGALEQFISKIDVNTDFDQISKFGTNLKILDIFDRKTRTFTSAGPIDFIKHLNGCDFLFTSSFHGTVLAIIFKKPFITVLSGNKGRDSRIVDLLSELGLNDRIFSTKMTRSQIFQDIDYDSVYDSLNILREQSLIYLNESLSKSVE